MKKIAIIIVTLFALPLASLGQKFAFVDTEYILSRIPTFKAAQEQLDRIATQYETEVQEKYQELDKMFQEFQAEKVLLTDEMRSKRETEMM